MAQIPKLTSPKLLKAGIRHGFFGRRGGVSSAIYESLNVGMGSDDRSDRVSENRARAIGALGVDKLRLVTCYQIHSAKALVVDTPWPTGDAPRADGLVTRERGLALAILTADCTPVLIADPVAGVIGAAHAGWQGAWSGIIGSTIEAMKGLGAEPERMIAAVGPTITQKSYEVGPEFHQKFIEKNPAFERFFLTGQGDRLLFDLVGFVVSRLEDSSLGNICLNAPDTYMCEADYFSYRRATHRGEGDYGRQISAIVLDPATN